MGSKRRPLVLVGAWSVLAACSFPRATLESLDAEPSPVGTDGRVDALTVGPYTNIVVIPGFDTPYPEDDPTLPADMLEIYFERSNDIWRSVRTSVNQPWSAPAIVPGINTGAEETTPEISADGLTLTFASGVTGDYDLYMTTRSTRGSSWTTPVALTQLNSSSEDFSATFVSPTLFYLSSSRPGIGNYDLWTAHATDTGWTTPVLVNGISTAGNENEPCVDPTETRIYFTGDGSGGRDLYTATRPDAQSPWGPRQPVHELNSDYVDGDVWVSPDGHTIYFSSDRLGDSDIFMATR